MKAVCVRMAYADGERSANGVYMRTVDDGGRCAIKLRVCGQFLLARLEERWTFCTSMVPLWQMDRQRTVLRLV